jgi:cytochrome d ubiquinol oxidase subunit II
MSGRPFFALALLGSLGAYLVLGGADFGAGIWECRLSFQKSRAELSLIHQALSPVWEVNHVWLIFALILCFGAFPTAFGAVFQSLWLPLLLALAGIVFRGAAFFMRNTPSGEGRSLAWDALFGAASLPAPFFLGMVAAALGRSLDGGGAWLSPLGLASGLFTVSVCVFLSACYLNRECAFLGLEAARGEAWRRRAMLSGAACAALGLAGLLLCRANSPNFFAALLKARFPLAGFFAALAAALAFLAARRRLAAVAFASAAAMSAVGAWGLALGSDILPGLPQDPVFTRLQNALSAAILLGMLLVLPSLGWLFWVFKGGRKP